jgi:hypothetical protein
MPKGPQGQRRPADVIGGAIKVAKIATGEEPEDKPAAKSAAAELGSKGGKARAKSLTKKERSENLTGLYLPLTNLFVQNLDRFAPRD